MSLIFFMVNFIFRIAVYGEASWYAEGLPNPDALTCASRTYERKSRLLVVHNWKFVVVRVNDYGPKEGIGRIVDLSRGAARKLNLLKKGVGQVFIVKIS